MPIGTPVSMLGLFLSGDLGDETIYTDRYGRKIHYKKSPPEKPPTEPQIQIRTRFKLAQKEYMALAQADRLDYELLVQRASLCMTGQNLFIHVAMKLTFGTLGTLQQQTGISVIPPTPRP